MKHIFTSVLASGLLLCSLQSCQEQQAPSAPSQLASQHATSAGSEISLRQAISFTEMYRAHHPDGLRAIGYSARAIQELLAQEDCTGIRIYNATNDAGKDIYVLVGVSAAGIDQTDDHVLDGSPRCPPWCAISPLSGELGASSSATAPAENPLTQEQAVRWTGTYQQHHVGQLRTVYYDADIFQELLKQQGATGIRIYQATTPAGQPTFVLVGIDGNYQDQTGDDHRIFANGLSCFDESCAPTSVLMH